MQIWRQLSLGILFLSLTYACKKVKHCELPKVMFLGCCRSIDGIKENEVEACKEGYVLKGGMCQNIKRLLKGDNCLRGEVKTPEGMCTVSILATPAKCKPGYILTAKDRCRPIA